MSAVLLPLVSKPLDIHTGSLSGRLMVYANHEKSTLCWVFRYDNEVDPAPVVISVAVNHRIHIFYCGITERINRIVKTRIIHPGFPIGNCKIHVIRVEPQVSVKLESLRGSAIKRLIAALGGRIVRPFRRRGPKN